MQRVRFFSFLNKTITLFLILCAFHSILSADVEPAYQVKKEVWTRHIIDDGISGPDGVRIGDLNNDGLPDIVCGWEEAGVTKVYLNPGPKESKKRWPGVVVGKTPHVEDAFFVDLDQDGRLDVVACTELKGEEVFIFWGPKEDKDLLNPEAWSGGKVPALSGLGGWMYGVPMQLDGKNGPDLFLGSKSRRGPRAMGWLACPENPRDLKAWKWHQLGKTHFLRSMVAEDMDYDGDLDVLINDDPDGKNPQGFNAFFWLENPGPEKVTQKWKRHEINPSAGLFFGVGDIDKDGLTDLAWSGKKVVVLQSQKDGSWKKKVVDAAPYILRSRGSHLRDFDGDGQLELVCSGTPHHIWNFDGSLDPANWTLTIITNSVGSKPDRNETFDVDGDGDFDLITCEENHQKIGLGLFWHENAGGKAGKD